MRAHPILVLIFTVAGLAAAGVVAAQRSDEPVVVSGEAMSFREAQQTLLGSRAQADEARRRSERLEGEARSATREADRASRSAAALAARIQESEADIRAAQARIAILDRLRQAQAARLAARQGPIVRLTAALQRLNRQPAAVALVQPGSISDAVHLRSVLDAVLPVIQQRTADVRAELHRSRQLRVVAQAAVDALRDGRTRLAAQRVEMAKIEAQQRIASRQFRSTAGLESQRALALGEQARDIVDLMDQLRVAGDVRDRLLSLAGPSLRPSTPGAIGMPRPIVTTSAARRPPPYRLPVVGTLVTGLGEVSDSGVRSRGLTIIAGSGGQVIAPANGRIVFAGQYRGYGQIVIIDHGEGWTSLVTGLSRLSVEVGNVLRQGDPVGNAGPGRPKITVELRRNGRPVDIVPLTGAG